MGSLDVFFLAFQPQRPQAHSATPSTGFLDEVLCDLLSCRTPIAPLGTVPRPPSPRGSFATSRVCTETCS